MCKAYIYIHYIFTYLCILYMYKHKTTSVGYIDDITLARVVREEMLSSAPMALPTKYTTLLRTRRMMRSGIASTSLRVNCILYYIYIYIRYKHIIRYVYMYMY